METFIFIRSMNWIERPFCAQFIISKRRKKSFKIFWNTKNWVRENGSLVFRVRRDQYQNMDHRRCCLWIEKQYGFLSMMYWMNRMNEHEQCLFDPKWMICFLFETKSEWCSLCVFGMFGCCCCWVEIVKIDDDYEHIPRWCRNEWLSPL